MQQCTQVDKSRDIPKRRAQGLAELYEKNSELKDGEKDVQGDEPSHPDEDDNKKGILAGNPFSLFSGVFPGKIFYYLLTRSKFNATFIYRHQGTKWCGTGDIAKDFHDLGTVGNICLTRLSIKAD